VDFKAGFEDSARGVLTSIDWAIAVVDPTVASVRLATHLARIVQLMRQGVPPATRHLERTDLVDLAVRQFRDASIKGVVAVLNRVSDPETERLLRSALAPAGPPVIGSLGEDSALQTSWLRGQRLDAADLERTARRIARELAHAVQHAGASIDE
jgi:CO dehydrogenase nickel-insertion accessory protein CooC1